LYDAPAEELSTATIACVPPGHPAITPSSVENRKWLAVPLTGKLVAALFPLKTIPVGVPPVSAVGVGICTIRPCFMPSPS